MRKIFLIKTLFFLNILTISFLIYFLYKGFYHSTNAISLHGRGDWYFEIRPDFKFLVVIAIVLPILIGILLKKHFWILQSLLIITISLFWKEDFLQKTLFINQPTSKARVHKIVKTFVDENEEQIKTNIKQLTEACLFFLKDFEGITTIQNINIDDSNFRYAEMDTTYYDLLKGKNYRYIKTYLLDEKFTNAKKYVISRILLKNKKIVRLDIILTAPEEKKQVWNSIMYYPQGINNGAEEQMYSKANKLNTHLYLEEQGMFVYKANWAIHIEGPFE